MPRVSIISGCFNNEKYLEEALLSVLNQTYKDFEYVVIDDNSTDSSLHILRKWSERDSRLRIIHNTKNLGLANTLNKAIDLTDSDYVVRFDTDDKMYPHRLDRQLTYMQVEKIELLGSSIKSLNTCFTKITHYPKEHDAIKLQLLFQTAFAHPSIIFKRNSLGSMRYDSTIKYAEDYDLWVRLSETVRMGNIREPLIHYRIHSNQISTKKQEQNLDAGKIRLNALHKLEIETSLEERKIHSNLRSNLPYESIEELLNVQNWLIKLALKLNYPSALQQIHHEWYLCCVKAAHFGLETWKIYRKSLLTKQNKTNTIKEIQLRFLCISQIEYKSNIYNKMTGL